MEGDLVKVPEELVKLHTGIYLKADLLFVNSTPFFITLSRNIFFTHVNHITNRKVETIFKAFKEIYSYNTNLGFHTTTIHAYGEPPPTTNYDLKAHARRTQDKSHK